MSSHLREELLVNKYVDYIAELEVQTMSFQELQNAALVEKLNRLNDSDTDEIIALMEEQYPTLYKKFQAELTGAIGVYGGLCNRTACRASGARWYNNGTQAYYCISCAEKINDASEGTSFYPLCTLHTQ